MQDGESESITPYLAITMRFCAPFCGMERVEEEGVSERQMGDKLMKGRIVRKCCRTKQTK